MGTTVKTIIALVLIFIFGFLAGVGATVITGKRIIKNAIENPGKARVQLIHRMSRQYRLDDDQKQAITTILDDQASELSGIFLGVAPEIEETLARNHDRIVAELNDEQKIKFEKHYKIWLDAFRKGYEAHTKQRKPDTND